MSRWDFVSTESKNCNKQLPKRADLQSFNCFFIIVYWNWIDKLIQRCPSIQRKTWYSRLNIDACTRFCVQFFALFSKWRWRILCNAILLRNGTMQMQLFLAQICLFCYFVSFSRSFKQTLTFLFYCESQIQIGSIQKFLHFDRNSFPRTLELTTHT